jgi:hypothetical protein
MEDTAVAQQVNVVFVDDLDGSEAAETVSFGLDGRQFSIDLSAGNAAQLRDALASFVAAARRGDSRSRGRAPIGAGPRRASSGKEIAAVREWAKANGHEVSDRGRISKTVLEAYGNRDVAAAVEKSPAKKSSRKG